MPTYQYECAACGHEFEVLQSMLEKKIRKCPECNKNRVDRLIGSGSGIIFKGSGFYETDYKRKTPEKAEPSTTKNQKTEISSDNTTSKKDASVTNNVGAGK